MSRYDGTNIEICFLTSEATLEHDVHVSQGSNESRETPGHWLVEKIHESAEISCFHVCVFHNIHSLIFCHLLWFRAAAALEPIPAVNR